MHINTKLHGNSFSSFRDETKVGNLTGTVHCVCFAKKRIGLVKCKWIANNWTELANASVPWRDFIITVTNRQLFTTNWNCFTNWLRVDCSNKILVPMRESTSQQYSESVTCRLHKSHASGDEFISVVHGVTTPQIPKSFVLFHNWLHAVPSNYTWVIFKAVNNMLSAFCEATLFWEMVAGPKKDEPWEVFVLIELEAFHIPSQMGEKEEEERAFLTRTGFSSVPHVVCNPTCTTQA